MHNAQFDARYYERYYKNPKTRVAGPADTERLACFVAAYLAYLRIPLRTVLDIGCGLGLWRSAFLTAGIDVTYTGVEVSPYVCDEYGWTRGSVVDFTSRRRYDLVVCQGVLPYLADAQVRPAVANLARLCRGALYMEAVTKEDWEGGACERKRFDRNMRLRRAAFYRKVVGEHFTSCGGGVFVRNDSRTVLYELERG
ncbi:MAG: class I SAM-dependent methyltransferase [bacterium]